MLLCSPRGHNEQEVNCFMKTKAAFVHSIISSRLNTRYIQPHYPLADNIISHATSWKVITRIYNAYKSYGLFTACLQTKYYDLDKVYIVTQKQNETIKNYKVIYRNDHQILEYGHQAQTTLEYVGENQFFLDKETFQVKKSYHHERQMILYVLNTANFSLEIDILLVGLDTFANRKQLFNLITSEGNLELVESNPAILGSFSFRFIVNDGMVRDELNEHVDVLHDIISD